MTARLSSFLDASRWIAAVLVVVHHVRHLVFADAAEVAIAGPLTKAFYFSTGLGGDAVMVFFVVSGYLVGGQAIVRFRSRGFDVGAYAVHRISRIYTVLIPALLLGGSLDYVGLHLFNQSGMYTNGAHHAALETFVALKNNLNVETFLGNLFMLEGVVVGRFGSNNPLWSLAYEWWYYCLFAAALVASTRRSTAARVIAGVALAGMLAFLPHRLLAWGAIWLVGVATALYARSSYGKPPAWLGYAFLALTLLGLRFTEHAVATGSADGEIASFGRASLVAVAYASLLLAYHRPGSTLPLEGVHERLARFSYTLYLVHYPMIVFCVCVLDATMHLGFLRKPDGASALYFVGLTAFVILCGAVVSDLTEKHTSNVRRALTSGVRLTRRLVSARS